MCVQSFLLLNVSLAFLLLFLLFSSSSFLSFFSSFLNERRQNWRIPSFFISPSYPTGNSHLSDSIRCLKENKNEMNQQITSGKKMLYIQETRQKAPYYAKTGRSLQSKQHFLRKMKTYLKITLQYSCNTEDVTRGRYIYLYSLGSNYFQVQMNLFPSFISHLCCVSNGNVMNGSRSGAFVYC